MEKNTVDFWMDIIRKCGDEGAATYMRSLRIGGIKACRQLVIDVKVADYYHQNYASARRGGMSHEDAVLDSQESSALVRHDLEEGVA